jgi:hypothetical protein
LQSPRQWKPHVHKVGTVQQAVLRATTVHTTVQGTVTAPAVATATFAPHTSIKAAPTHTPDHAILKHRAMQERTTQTNVSHTRSAACARPTRTNPPAAIGQPVASHSLFVNQANTTPEPAHRGRPHAKVAVKTLTWRKHPTEKTGVNHNHRCAQRESTQAHWPRSKPNKCARHAHQTNTNPSLHTKAPPASRRPNASPDNGWTNKILRQAQS